MSTSTTIAVKMAAAVMAGEAKLSGGAARVRESEDEVELGVDVVLEVGIDMDDEVVSVEIGGLVVVDRVGTAEGAKLVDEATRLKLKTIVSIHILIRRRATKNVPRIRESDNKIIQ